MSKKLEKWSFESSDKGANNENSNIEFNDGEESDKEPITKKGSSLGLMSIEEIENLITDTVKAHLERGSHKLIVIASLIQKGLMHCGCLMDSNLYNLINLTAKEPEATYSTLHQDLQ